jgi:hypothetical protein
LHQGYSVSMSGSHMHPDIALGMWLSVLGLWLLCAGNILSRARNLLILRRGWSA